ncbi:MAG: hypothetical protein KatS3mg008_1065 [Acidimicrobiales bacterium]|nr:MAG: hypothetical protein KatS3mg008_1065 [Acidimicrobiales bacterium]
MPHAEVNGERRRGRVLRTAALVGSALLLGAVGLAVATVLLAQRGVVESHLGDESFRGLRADRTARLIEREGPLLLPDPAEGVTPIWLNHLGEEVEEGWVAFDALAPGCDESMTWVEAKRHFVDPCTGRVWPPDGKGLRHHRVKIVDGEVVVDIARG